MSSTFKTLTNTALRRKALDATKNIVTSSVVMNELVTFAHALADDTRWRILQLICNEPLCVCELADILKMPQSSVSSHVQVIRKAGLLDEEKCGKWMYYRVAQSHRRLLFTLGEFFEITTSSDAVLKADAKRAVKRLSERDGGCCPLPTALTKLKPITSKSLTRYSDHIEAS
jgi:ArsR family transcriptional regulator